MRITEDHLRFWREKKAGTPKWAPPPSRLATPAPPLIHKLINQQDTSRKALDGHEMSNMLALMRSQRKLHGELYPWLFDLMARGSTKKRRVFARRLVRRLNRVSQE